MAVCVCDADGVQSAAEQAFLADLRSALALDEQQAAAYTQRVEEIAAMPVAAASRGDNTAGTAKPPAAGYASTLSEAELDSAILNAAILNGALELLPESLSTMAIIPLQMKLVYRIGQSYGFELDRGHIKDFLATLGVGLTSQYLEQAGRKLLGGLLGKIGGGLLGGIGKQAVSSGMSFASTYALGHVARRYYAGGRSFSTQMLRERSTICSARPRAAEAATCPRCRPKRDRWIRPRSSNWSEGLIADTLADHASSHRRSNAAGSSPLSCPRSFHAHLR
jgi:uncharacterized protein (DUF697 family)